MKSTIHKKKAFAACLIFAANAFLFSVSVFAHDGLHEQIVAITKEIKKNPRNAALFLKRAELYRLHEDWKNSENDFNRAEKLNPNLTGINLGRGKLFFEKGEFLKAEKYLKIHLEKEPESFEGILTFARVAVKRKEIKIAAEYFARAIALSPADSAEIYIERAKAFSNAGQFENALNGLDEGIKKLGNLVTLQTAAIDAEVKRKNYDAALLRLDKLTAQMERKESFLMRRGEILLEAGKSCEARAAFLEAQKGFESLTPFRKKARAVKEQFARLEKLLIKTSVTSCD